MDIFCPLILYCYRIFAFLIASPLDSFLDSSLGSSFDFGSLVDSILDCSFDCSNDSLLRDVIRFSNPGVVAVMWWA